MPSQPSLTELVDLDDVVDLTSALVSVDTRNPPGGEAPIEQPLRQALSARNPEWTKVEPAEGRLSLIAELPHPEGPSERPTLIINGHTDVVPVHARAWSQDPFSPWTEGDHLYGRGTADMKGGIAAAICALDVLERAGLAPGCDIVFHLVADEEVGGRLGTKVLLDSGHLAGDACLVPEPTGLALCIAERGLLQSRVTVHGVPAHGSRPHEGVSAIEKAAAVITALHNADFGGSDHDLLGKPTANIGTIQGGSTVNTVAESCVLGVDRRVLPGATADSSLAEIKRQIDAAGIAGLEYEIEPTVFGEASENARDHPWIGLVGDAVRSATGRDPELIGMSFTTDARFVRNQAGIPTVVCGPGEVAQAHSNDEWVSLAKLREATAAFAALFAGFSRPF